MTTIPKSVSTQLSGDWTGAGGTAPTFYLQEEDFRTPPPLGEDSVWIMSKSLDTGDDPFNDTFVNEKHVLRLIVNTATDADRLKELSDEVVRILNATAITDIDVQRMRGRTREVTQNLGIWVFQEVITYDLRQNLKDSSAAYGAGATGTFAVAGDLTVAGTAAITGVTTFADESLTSTQMADLLMFGSANSAWVNCVISGITTSVGLRQFLSDDSYANIDGTDYHSSWELPLPTNKGGLSLHISDFRVVINDADAQAYVDHVYVKALKGDGSVAAVADDGTNLDSQGTHDYNFGGDVDVTLREKIHVRLQCVVDVAGELNVGGVLLKCYYDT